MEWLLSQAQTASPFVAFFCLGACSLLWRQHIKDQRTIASITLSVTRAMIASARAMEKLSAEQRRASRSPP